MPNIDSEQLTRICHDILIKFGANEEEASTVAKHLVGANLVGHDSHGVLQLAGYIDRIKKGHIVPGAKLEVLKETPTTAKIDGHWGFGMVVQTKAVQMAIEKAKKNMVAAVTVACQSHIGMLNTYTRMAAAEGLIAQMHCDSGRGPKQMAPFGGRDARMGTNPICIALPSDLTAPLFIDMATSQVAAGKIILARSRHQQVPVGWMVDKDGNMSTNPDDFFAGGALMPVGGPDGGYKGYGLGAVIEVFAGILTGLGWEEDPHARHNDGSFFIAINVAAFQPIEKFRAEVADFARYLKSSRPAKGFKEVFYPGEIEWLTMQERLKTGIPVEDDTWAALNKLAA